MQVNGCTYHQGIVPIKKREGNGGRRERGWYLEVERQQTGENDTENVFLLFFKCVTKAKQKREKKHEKDEMKREMKSSFKF